MAGAKITVLYPYPPDVAKFNSDYQDHLKLLHQKLQVPEDMPIYEITRFIDTPLGRPAYYLMFTLPFPSATALQQAMGTQELQDMAANVYRVSSGGDPVILVAAG